MVADVASARRVLNPSDPVRPRRPGGRPSTGAATLGHSGRLLGSRSVVRWLPDERHRDRGADEPEPERPGARSPGRCCGSCSRPASARCPDVPRAGLTPRSRRRRPVGAGRVPPDAGTGYGRVVSRRARAPGHTAATLAEGHSMPIRVDVYIAGGWPAGTVRACRARCATPSRPPSEPDPRRAPSGRARRTPRRARPAPSSIPIDDILVAVADDDPSSPVHAAWHHIAARGRPVRCSRASCRRCPGSTLAER